MNDVTLLGMWNTLSREAREAGDRAIASIPPGSYGDLIDQRVGEFCNSDPPDANEFSRRNLQKMHLVEIVDAIEKAAKAALKNPQHANQIWLCTKAWVDSVTLDSYAAIHKMRFSGEIELICKGLR